MCFIEEGGNRPRLVHNEDQIQGVKTLGVEEAWPGICAPRDE